MSCLSNRFGYCEGLVCFVCRPVGLLVFGVFLSGWFPLLFWPLFFLGELFGWGWSGLLGLGFGSVLFFRYCVIGPSDRVGICFFQVLISSSRWLLGFLRKFRREMGIWVFPVRFSSCSYWVPALMRSIGSFPSSSWMARHLAVQIAWAPKEVCISDMARVSAPATVLPLILVSSYIQSFRIQARSLSMASPCHRVVRRPRRGSMSSPICLMMSSTTVSISFEFSSSFKVIILPSSSVL